MNEAHAAGRETMAAVVCREYGPPEVLEWREVGRPVPAEDEVLVRVRASSVNYGDLLARNFKAVSPRTFNMPFLFWLIARISFGPRKPKKTILGNEFAGEIAAVGRNVTRFKPGDEVFGLLGEGMGAYAGYVRVAENGSIAFKPAHTSDEEAAAIPYGAVMALALLRKARIAPGQKVLVLGASGSIGMAAVQIARHLGAEVHGAASAARLELVRSLGAARAFDYARDDFAGSGERYDLIFDVLGRSSFARCREALAPRGLYLCASFKTGKLLRMLWTSLGRGQRALCAIAPGSVSDLIAVRERVEAGHLRAFVDRVFPLRQAAAAHRYVEEGHARGKVVISVEAEGEVEK